MFKVSRNICTIVYLSQTQQFFFSKKKKKGAVVARVQWVLRSSGSWGIHFLNTLWPRKLRMNQYCGLGYSCSGSLTLRSVAHLTCFSLTAVSYLLGLSAYQNHVRTMRFILVVWAWLYGVLFRKPVFHWSEEGLRLVRMWMGDLLQKTRLLLEKVLGWPGCAHPVFRMSC